MGWYFVDVSDDFEKPLVLMQQEGSLEGREFLPEEGFVLHDNPPDDLVVREARKRNNTVLDVSVSPPEAAEEHRIRVKTLCGLLKHVQTIVEYAYRRAAKECNIRVTDGYLMDAVVPAHSGSFGVTLEAAGSPDLFGFGEIQRGLERVDLLFESAMEPETACERMQAHKGHLARSYVNLMRFLSDHDTGMRYAWAGPDFSGPRCGGVSKALARKLVNELSKVSNLQTEEVIFSGDFVKVNRTTGRWGLETNEGIKSGRMRKNGPSLDGLVVGKRYTFYCSEEIEIFDATGQEDHTHYLEKYEPE